jgi:sugar lactone lactonase YvrE
MEGAINVVVFDVSTAVFVDSFSVSAQETIPRGIAFNTDGTKMFIVGTTGDDVNEYTLSTGFDVSTASFVDSFSVSAQDTSPAGIAFNTDGTKMFIVGNAGEDVNEYTLSTGFDVSTASFVDSFSVAAQETDPNGIAFNTDGTKMFIVGYAGDDVNEYTLSTGFDVSTASFVDNFSVAAQETTPYGIAFNIDGTKMFIVGEGGDDVNEYTLSTGFDVSTASFVDSFSVAAQETSPTGIAFNTDGTKMFIVGYDGDDVNEYNIGTTNYTNQMNKTQLDAVTDANQFVLTNDLDLAIVLRLVTNITAPSSSGVAINYDANILNEGAVLGVDYDFDAPAGDKARITAIAGNNLNVRVV